MIAETVEINGITFSGFMLAELFAMVTNPDPHKWFRLERKHTEGLPDVIICHVKYDDAIPET